uniref:Uncharacterized protein n=1 Tax=Oryza punctata TaxID=4537 RepID=A0A0E0MPK6_ORYPU
MATLDGLVCGRGDPFCSLTLSVSNPTTWIELKCTGGRDSALIADRRRGVEAIGCEKLIYEMPNGWAVQPSPNSYRLSTGHMPTHCRRAAVVHRYTCTLLRSLIVGDRAATARGGEELERRGFAVEEDTPILSNWVFGWIVHLDHHFSYKCTE